MVSQTQLISGSLYPPCDLCTCDPARALSSKPEPSLRPGLPFAKQSSIIPEKCAIDSSRLVHTPTTSPASQFIKTGANAVCDYPYPIFSREKPSQLLKQPPPTYAHIADLAAACRAHPGQSLAERSGLRC